MSTSWVETFCEVMRVELIGTVWLDGEIHFKFSDGEILSEREIRQILSGLKGVELSE